MDFARVRVKSERMTRREAAMPVPLVKAMQQAEWQAPPPKASQPVELRQVLGNRREQVKSPRQETAPVVGRLDPQAPVFALKGQWS